MPEAAGSGMQMTTALMQGEWAAADTPPAANAAEMPVEVGAKATSASVAPPSVTAANKSLMTQQRYPLSDSALFPDWVYPTLARHLGAQQPGAPHNVGMTLA